MIYKEEYVLFILLFKNETITMRSSRGSNPGPLGLKPNALPTELPGLDIKGKLLKIQFFI